MQWKTCFAKTNGPWLVTLLCCVLLCAFLGCESSDKDTDSPQSQTSYVSPEDANSALYIILFDISKSLGEKALDVELLELTRWFDTMEQTKENTIIILTVHGNTAKQNGPVFEETIDRNWYSTDLSRRREYEDSVKVCAARACESIRSTREAIDDGGHTLLESCFIDALQSTRSRFTDKRFSRTLKHLVIIGDMIEDCSRIQIDLDNDSVDLYYPERSLSPGLEKDTYLQTVQIRIFIPKIPGGNLQLPTWYTDQKLRSFWEYVFASQGADTSQISSNW